MLSADPGEKACALRGVARLTEEAQGLEMRASFPWPATFWARTGPDGPKRALGLSWGVLGLILGLESWA